MVGVGVGRRPAAADACARRCPQSIGVIATPTMCNHSILVEDTYLVLASDGVWEFLPNESVINMVHQHFLGGQSAQQACLFIIAKAAAVTVAPKSNLGVTVEAGGNYRVVGRTTIVAPFQKRHTCTTLTQSLPLSHCGRGHAH